MTTTNTAKHIERYAYQSLMKDISYYQDDTYETQRYQCSDCRSMEQKIDDAKEYLQGVLDALYSSHSLDTGMLESNLDELCRILEVKPNLGELQIQRKEKITKIQKVTKQLSFIAN